MDRGDLADTEADQVLAEPRTLVADDRPVGHLDDRGKEMIAARPATGAKGFSIHIVTVVQSTGLSQRQTAAEATGLTV